MFGKGIQFGNFLAGFVSAFLSFVVNFFIMAFILFCLMKVVNKAAGLGKKKEEETPLAAPAVKICPFCKSEISVDATRCLFCTSEILKEE